jgi:hypothetical protein
MRSCAEGLLKSPKSCFLKNCLTLST